MRQMPSILNHLQAGIGQLACQLDAVTSGHNPVIVTCDYQDRLGDLVQPLSYSKWMVGESEFP